MALYFRTANKNDCDLMFSWANDIETRKNAFTSGPIAYEQHVKWFNNLNLNLVLIFSDENQNNIGIARIDNKNGEWVITTMVDQKHRGKGIGGKMLSLATNEFFTRNTSVHEIIAYIKETNIPSIKAFSKSGFKELEKITLFDFKCVKMGLVKSN